MDDENGGKRRQARKGMRMWRAQGERTYREAIGRGDAIALGCEVMRCDAIQGWFLVSCVEGLNSTPGRPEGKDEERRVRTVRALGSYLGGTGDVQKRRFARIEIQWKDWTTTTTGGGGVVG